ncbi:hypothetical protein [Enhygromyxa salina]|uniref:Uncharacterized protein n=1 Tax=Enhygromyxa salina TaxID=215803 RepID=A0A2S9YUK7_9BACT|nr:hypothetical protein [Enhygromyxa salina]PRQ08795.1 hypothetical protein ENSA7_14270 [Enhygromyxa salina]
MALVGLVVGILVSVLLTAGTNRIGVFNIAIPLIMAGGFFMLSHRLTERLVPVKAKDPYMRLSEIETLEQIQRAEEEG